MTFVPSISTRIMESRNARLAVLDAMNVSMGQQQGVPLVIQPIIVNLWVDNVNAFLDCSMIH
jgi:hypothetical protein